MFKLSNYVKLPTWLQFVGYFLMIGAAIGDLLGHKNAGVVGLLALAVSAGAFLYRQLKNQLGYDKKLRELLQVGSYIFAFVGMVPLLVAHRPEAAWFVYLGVGTGLAGLFYEVIYP